MITPKQYRQTQKFKNYITEMKSILERYDYKLYKYCSMTENNLQNLAKNEIFLSNITNFNDPFECLLSNPANEFLTSFYLHSVSTTHSNILSNYQDFRNAASEESMNPDNIFFKLNNLLTSFDPNYKNNFPNPATLMKSIGLRKILKVVLTPDYFTKIEFDENLNMMENDDKIYDLLSEFLNDDLKVNSRTFKRYIGYLNKKGIIDNDYYSGLIKKLEGIENMNKKARLETSKYFGVSCFSSSKKNILMWSHYSDKHRGFVVEYDLKSFIYKEPINPILLPIIYSKNRVNSEIFLKNDIIKEKMTNEMIAEDIAKGLITKSDIWEYESEFRLISKIKNSKGQVQSFPYAKWVYVGSEMSSNHIEILKNLCKQKNIGLSQNILHDRNYKIQKKYKILFKPEKTVKSPQKGILEMKSIERKDLPKILYNILTDLGGSADMLTIFKEFHRVYGAQIKEDNPLFYTWNYDIRWAATTLRRQGLMSQAKRQENTYGEDITSKGIWSLKKTGK